MARTRILLTGADCLTGSHILAQLLSKDLASVRAVVDSFEAAHTIHKHYQSIPSSTLDLFTLSGDEQIVSGITEDALSDSIKPFEAVIHTLIPKHSDEADCLTKFIHLETESVIKTLASVQRVAHNVRRVVIVTTLAPFARWLISPQPGGSLEQGMIEGSLSAPVDTEDLLATSQASSSTVHDAVLKWMRSTGTRFDVVYISTPSIYGPTVHPLETSSDLSETNRRIWNICSNEPQERTELPPYNISHYSDVRDVAAASVRALFVTEASNRYFIVSAGTMPRGSEIAQYLFSQYPELRNRVRVDRHSPQHHYLDGPPFDAMDTYLVTTVLGLSRQRSLEATINDIVQQILDLQQRKAWKSIIQS